MSRTIVALLALQVLNLGLVAGVLLRENQSDGADELGALRNQISGALHQQQQVTMYLDGLRGQLQQLLLRADPATAEVQSGPVSPPPAIADQREAPGFPSASEVPFAEALRRFLALKETFQQREQASNNENTFLLPFESKLDEQQVSLLRLGTDVLHWIHHEIGLQPYHEERDPAFLEFVLEELIPELSSANGAACFELCRDALVKVTNENLVRQAAARTMKLIDDDRRWVNEYLAVIAKGGQRKRDISLRVSLLDVFAKNPDPAIVPVVSAFLKDPLYPAPLRVKAAGVLGTQESPAVDDVLRKVVFEDAYVDLRLQGLDALYRRWADRKDTRDLKQFLEDIVAADAEQMHSQVQQKALVLLDALVAKENATE